MQDRGHKKEGCDTASVLRPRARKNLVKIENIIFLEDSFPCLVKKIKIDPS